MPEYLIEEAHTPEECLVHFDQLAGHPRRDELLKSTYAACGSGTHVAWTIAAFKDEDDARSIWRSVPSLLKKIKVYPVEVFTAEQIQAYHEE